KKALALEKKIQGLRAEAKFAEALAPAREVLALRESKQGTEHWQTADARRLVETLTYLAGQSAVAQRELAALEQLRDDVIQFQLQREDAEAVPLLRQAADVSQKILGEDHPETVAWYSELANGLVRKGGDLVEAEKLQRRVLADHVRLLGARHPD